MIDDDYEGTNGMATEAYLITPVIDLSGAPTDLKLEFDQYFQEWQNDNTRGHQYQRRSDLGGDPDQ